MKKVILGSIAVLTALLLSACTGSTGESDKSDASLLSVNNSGRLTTMEKTSFDWGDINIEGGKVEHVFTLKNSGEEDLIIKSANTTCMCTTATVEAPDGSASPTFGMHESIPWGYPIKPGEDFNVKVVFDPMAHGPTGVGAIQRSVFILSSSKPNAEFAQQLPEASGSAVTELKLTGNVLSKADYEKKNNAVAFKFNETEFDFGVVKQSGGIVTREFEFEYLGQEPITVTATPTSCACTTAKISQQEFKKGDKGILTVEFDPNLHEEPEGKFFKTVNLTTEPALDVQPEIKIWAELDLDLGPDAFKLKGEHNDDEEITYRNVSAADFLGMLQSKDFFLLDVHIPEQEHIENTDAFIPYNEIESNLPKLPQDKSAPIVVYCRSGSMSLEASQKLIDLGYTNVTNLQGGLNAYLELI